MKIALIAHDQKKPQMIEFVTKFKGVLENHQLVATGTTGKRITEATGLSVERMQSGPLGGDQQIGSMVAQGEIGCVIFRDPHCSAP